MSNEPNTPFTGASPAQIDLIGTISLSLMTIGAPFATAWTKRFSPRAVIMAGGLIFGAACILASYSQKLWQFELTQGLLLGIGTCLAYMPAVTVTPTWFDARRGLAMGIVLSGTGVGGVIFAPALKALNDKLGFRNTLRLSGALSFVLLVASGSVIDWDRRSEVMQRVLAAENNSLARRSPLLRIPLIDWRVARSRKFIAQAISASLQSAAYYTPVFFFASYAKTLGYSASTGANFIALSNAMNAVGKIVIGHLADRMGRLNTLFLTTLISAVTALAFWLPSTLQNGDGNSRELFIAFTVLYGIFASAYVSLFPTALVEIFGVANFASVNGFLYMVRGLSTLVGTPAAGALIRSSAATHGMPISFENTSVMVGILLAAATIAVLWVRIEAMLGATSKWRL